ncbi:putative lipoate-protein ligase A [Babesia divergens]|uniref:lipoate--protein ligase n=1 Tax=Babesia divergens TaxID=32595 RepID=A0AAD9GJH9_BABDI|nr:putative lipoate-protein ligase A [Babesia divergens]
MGCVSLFRRYFGTCVKQPNKKLCVIFSDVNDIYFNLALENSLLSSYGTNDLKENTHGAPLLFFWRNSSSVIIGCNQNVWSECNLDNVKRDNVNLVRRFTGGGAVYQDIGNTCFTFISPVDNYSFDQNSKIICAALTKLIGETCEPSGRNDLCVNGLKASFSGSAFKVHPNAALHHGEMHFGINYTWHTGTLLININQGSLDKYLTPDKSKLDKHNVKSVKSRVTNLSAFKKSITHESVCEAIIKEVAEHYGSSAQEIKRVNMNSEYCQVPAFTDVYNKLVDPKWIYGERVLQYKSLKHRFDFGSVEFCFDLNNDLVEKLWTFSDCLNADFIAWLNENLNKTPLRFSAADFDRALGGLSYEGYDDMISAVRSWIVAELTALEPESMPKDGSYETG